MHKDGMSRITSKSLRAIAIGFGAGVMACLVWQSGWLESWEALTWTWRARFFAQREVPSPNIKLILLDQASLDWAQRENAWAWPWPREAYGAISAFCKRGGARIFCLDLLFTEPSVYGVSDDVAMGEALHTGPPAVLAVLPGGSQDTWPAYIPHTDVKVDSPAISESPHFLFPVQEIATGITSVGHVTGLPDKDSTYRRLAPFCRFAGIEVPVLGLAAWLTTHKQPQPVTVSTRHLQVGDKTIALDRNGNAILRFKGHNGLASTVSAASVIQSELRMRAEETLSLAPEIFKDAYVFVGCSAPALLDLRPVPVNPKCPGVALHATFVDNLITDSFIIEGPFAIVTLVVIATAVGAALSLTYGGRWWQAGPFGAVWLCIPVLIGFAGYARGYWWPIVVQETAAAIGLVGALVANYWAEGRQKAYIKQAFKHYLSSEVIEKILRNPRHLQLGGEKRELTILFTDLAGFSTLSEKLGPVELTSLLNDYLSEMTDIILEEGGTLDKYEGDAIIAFWNAPLEQPDHAVRACRAVLRCQQRLAQRREDYLQRTGATLRMRAGLNTGEVVVGNMGSSKRFNYTILGDAANLASRLEGANKAFGTETMISESTWRLVSTEFRARKLADLRVIGRKTAVPVYELTGLVSDAISAGWETFRTGLELFAQGDFAGAIKVLEQLPNDPAAGHYIRRCQALMAHPPESWDGVWEMTEK
jgi:adenylate cyclase